MKYNTINFKDNITINERKFYGITKEQDFN